jgi:hypothetical protein
MPRVYDLAMTHQLDADDLFIRRIQQRCAVAGLSFFLIEPLWLGAFDAHLQAGRVRVRVLLNMHSEHHLPEDPFHQFVRRAFALGTEVIDPPDTAQAAFDKSRLHGVIASAGLPVPRTIVVDGDRPSSVPLAADQLEGLGRPFVIKPAMGYGRRGVILDATGPEDLARSVAGWNVGPYLFQEKVMPRLIGDEPAYFRVYYVFGATWLTWWNCYTDRYREVTEQEESNFGLAPLRDLARRLADLTGMRFFSTEIAWRENGDFVLVDYLNDQCHMLSQSADPRIGVPDGVVESIADRLVASAAALGQRVRSSSAGGAA